MKNRVFNARALAVLWAGAANAQDAAGFPVLAKDLAPARTATRVNARPMRSCPEKG